MNADEVPEGGEQVIQLAKQTCIDQTLLRRKISQVIGFALTPETSVEMLRGILEQANQTKMLEQVDQLIEESKKVKSEQGVMNFFKKDTSKIQDNRGQGIYAIEPAAPEMNEVERIYRIRDQRIQAGLLQEIILPEEEHKKHYKDGTLPMPPKTTG